MSCKKLDWIFGISAALFMAHGEMTIALSQEIASNELSPGQIFQKVQARYAALDTYSDQGQIVTLGGDKNVTTFTIRLARENFYRIEWAQQCESSPGTKPTPQAVWSTGVFNLLETGRGAEKQYTRELALANAAPPSSGAATTIPLIFFNIQDRALGIQVDDLDVDVCRQTDEPVGGVDCYVFSKESSGQTRTLWVGKQDFLIRQVRTVTSAAAAAAMLAKLNTAPASIGLPQGAASLAFTTVETHANIVVDQPFSRQDFAPSFPSFAPVNGR